MKTLIAFLGFLLSAGVAHAADAKLDSGDTAWMLVSTVLVIIMIVPGLALFYGGMVRAKNVLSVLMQVLVIFSMMSILWALFGYSLAFSEGNSFIGGFGKAFLSGVKPDSLQGTIPELLFAAFQLTFAAITPALIVGAFAERMKFSAVLWFMALWLFVCYVPIAHMVWGGGWIGGMGAIDFAGGTVVHINAGVAGLVAAVVLGKRKSYGKLAMPPHNLTFTLTGAALLWAGWFGFNAGSPRPPRCSAGPSPSGSLKANRACSVPRPAPSPAWLPSRRPAATPDRWAPSCWARSPASSASGRWPR
jgi:ammonium transporter, Amt family